jgi:hypothetical protein
LELSFDDYFMKNIALKYLPFLLLTFIGCSGDDITDSDDPIRTPDWVPNSITQPVPSWGSSNRLQLPVELNQIVLGPEAGIGGFGAHAGGHPEGLDHVWIEIMAGIPIRSWANGTVARIEDMTGEYFITIEYDGGLIGKHMEVKTPLVSIGQHVNAGDPVCYGLTFGALQSAEFMLIDKNRNDGVTAGGYGANVSPFDYLRNDIKAALEQKYSNEVITPYFLTGRDAGNNRRLEPYLTNPVLFHKNYKRTIAGEWILNSRWGQGGAFDILVLLDVVNPYINEKRILAADDNTQFDNYIDGTWSADTTARRFTFDWKGINYFGIYELNETGARATLKIEYRTGSYPAVFTNNASLYIERTNLPRRVDAENLGVY